MYKTIIASALVGAAVALKTDLASSSQGQLAELFEGFKAQFRQGRPYASADEEKHRFGIFVENLSVIDKRNALEDADGAVHGVTRFSDMTQDEFNTMYLSSRVVESMRSRNATIASVSLFEGSSTAVDYTGVQTTAIKDQGSCGSCWAHAAAEQIESDGMRLLKNSASVELSVQQLVSCDKGEGQHGCGGGLQEPGFTYVHNNGGIVSAKDYPYTAHTTRCDTSKNNYIMGVNGYKMILTDSPAQTEKDFTSYMLSTGTISIGADATTWNTYKSGIMKDCGKGTDVNHAVQLVGVDTVSGFWKIRNSWGPAWGEEGNIRIAYGANTCSLATEGGSYTDVFNIH